MQTVLDQLVGRHLLPTISSSTLLLFVFLALYFKFITRQDIQNISRWMWHRWFKSPWLTLRTVRQRRQLSRTCAQENELFGQDSMSRLLCSSNPPPLAIKVDSRLSAPVATDIKSSVQVTCPELSYETAYNVVAAYYRHVFQTNSAVRRLCEVHPDGPQIQKALCHLRLKGAIDRAFPRYKRLLRREDTRDLVPDLLRWRNVIRAVDETPQVFDDDRLLAVLMHTIFWFQRDSLYDADAQSP